MKEYEVNIVETLKKTVTVEAESLEDAKYRVQKAWGKGDYILDADDFSGLEFELSPYQVDMSYREMTALFRAAERAKQSVSGYIVFTADSSLKSRMRRMPEPMAYRAITKPFKVRQWAAIPFTVPPLTGLTRVYAWSDIWLTRKAARTVGRSSVAI